MSQQGHPRFTAFQCTKNKGGSCEQCPMYTMSPKVPPHEIHADNHDKILVIGEAPAMNELEHPYQGASGMFIRRLFQDVGVYSSCVFTNIVQCRRYHYEEGRDYPLQDGPEWDEINQCRPIVDGMIRRYKPKVIVTLGALAWHVISGGESKMKVTDAAGRFWRTPRHPLVFPLLNPAGILKTGSHMDYQGLLKQAKVLAKQLGVQNEEAEVRTPPQVIPVCPPWADAAMFNLLVQPPEEWKHRLGVALPYVDYKWQELINELEENPEQDVVIDLETSSLDPYSQDAAVLTISLAFNSDEAYALPVTPGDLTDYASPWEQLGVYREFFRFLDVVIGDGRRKVWVHTAAFDADFLAVLYAKFFGSEWKHADNPQIACTLLYHAAQYPNDPHNLEDITEWLGYKFNHKSITKAWDDHLKAQGIKPDWLHKPLWLLAPYNALDSAVTYALLDHLNERAKETGLRLEESRIRAYGVIARRMTRLGIKADLEATDIAENMIRPMMDEAECNVYFNPAVMRLMLEKWGFPVDAPYTLENMRAFYNIGSGPQTSKLLFGSLDLQDESMGLGADRSLSAIGKKGNAYSVKGAVLELIVGQDWPQEMSKIARSVVDPDGKTRLVLGAEEFHDKVQHLVDRGMEPTRALDALKPYAVKHVATSIEDRRHWAKMLSTYVVPMREEHAGADGMFHPRWKVEGAVTGRWSSFYHTMPRGVNKALKAIKNQFISRFPNGVLKGCDQGQVEARIAAVLSGDQAMLSIFHQRRDIHREVAAAYYQAPAPSIDKLQRDRIKAIHFGVIFRRTAESLAVNLMSDCGMKWDEALKFAQDFIKMYWEMFPELYKWRETVFHGMRDMGATIASVQHRGKWDVSGFANDPLNYVIVTPFGRPLYIPKGVPYNEMQRFACNYPIQSTAGDITNSALVRIDRRLRAKGMLSVPIMSVHDALYVDTHPDEVAEVDRIMVSEMLDTRDYADWIMGCPLATELQTGRAYGSLDALPAVNTDQVTALGYYN